MLQEKANSEIEFQNNGKTSTLIGVFLILAAISFYVFYLSGVKENIDTTKTDLVAKQGELSVIQAELSEFKKAENDLNVSTEVQRSEVSKSIPLGLKQDELIKDVIEISEVNDIILNSLSFGKGGLNEDGVGSVRINASFEGNYTDLVSFLESIEQNSRFLKVSSINVQLNKLEISDSTRATFSLAMEAFYQEEK